MEDGALQDELDQAQRDIDELRAQVRGLSAENRTLRQSGSPEPEVAAKGTRGSTATTASAATVRMAAGVRSLKSKLDLGKANQTSDELYEENLSLKEEMKASNEKMKALQKKVEEYKKMAQDPVQKLAEVTSQLQHAELERERQRHDFQLARQTSQRQIQDLEDQLETSLVQHFSAKGASRGRGNSLDGDSLAAQLGGLEEADEDEDEERGAGGGDAGFDPNEMARMARENVRLQSQLASSEEAVEALKLQARRESQLRMGAKWQLVAARKVCRRMEESDIREDNRKLRGMLESERQSSEEAAAGLQARAESAEQELERLRAGAAAPPQAQAAPQGLPDEERASMTAEIARLRGELEESRASLEERASMTAEIARLRGELEESRASLEAARPAAGAPGTEPGAQGDEALQQLKLEMQQERDVWLAAKQQYEQRLEQAAGAQGSGWLAEKQQLEQRLELGLEQNRGLEQRLRAVQAEAAAAQAAAAAAAREPPQAPPQLGGPARSVGSSAEELHGFSQKAPGSAGRGFSRFEIEDPNALKQARDAEEADRCANRCSNACAIT